MADGLETATELRPVNAARDSPPDSATTTEHRDVDATQPTTEPSSPTDRPKPNTSSQRNGSEPKKATSQPTGGATGSRESGRSRERRDYAKNDLQTSLENEFRTMATTYSKETVDSMDFLSESKDRAQLTATSAMSLSLIVVLKEILDQEPEAKYHMASLVLVVICLGLQVTVGLLALYMYQLKAKISIFKKRAEVKQRPVHTDPKSVYSEDDDTKRINDALSYSVAGVSKVGKDDREGLRFRGSLPVLPPSQSSGLDKLNDTLLQMLTDLYADVMIDIQKIQMQLISASDAEIEQLQKSLNRKSDVLRLVGAQLQIAELKNEMAIRRDMFVKVTMIQNAITYLLYITFVINAFLTGFGISEQKA